MVAVCQLADAGPDGINAPAVSRLQELLHDDGFVAGRESAAFALTLCGSPQLAATIVRLVGTTEPKDIERGLQEWENARQRGVRRGGGTVCA